MKNKPEVVWALFSDRDSHSPVNETLVSVVPTQPQLFTISPPHEASAGQELCVMGLERFLNSSFSFEFANRIDVRRKTLAQ